MANTTACGDELAARLSPSSCIERAAEFYEDAERFGDEQLQQTAQEIFLCLRGRTAANSSVTSTGQKIGYRTESRRGPRDRCETLRPQCVGVTDVRADKVGCSVAKVAGGQSSVSNDVPPAGPPSLADARYSSLGYTASQLANLLVSEVVDDEARLLQLVTDIHGG